MEPQTKEPEPAAEPVPSADARWVDGRRKRQKSLVEGLTEAIVANRGPAPAENRRGLAISRKAELERDERERALQRMEAELYGESVQVTLDSLAFRDIDPGMKEPPPEWIEKLGKERAWQKFKVALESWQPQKSAATGVKNALLVTLGIARLRAQAAKPEPTLHATVTVQMPAPASLEAFPSKVVTVK